MSYNCFNFKTKEATLLSFKVPNINIPNEHQPLNLHILTNTIQNAVFNEVFLKMGAKIE